MRMFTCGIILEDGCVVGDSYTEILGDLHIANTNENAKTLFVKAKLSPKNGEWWTDPATWVFDYISEFEQEEYAIHKSELVPVWFMTDKEKYKQMLVKAVTIWTDEHVLVNRNIEELSSGVYLLRNCRVKKLSGAVTARLSTTIVNEIKDNAYVDYMDAHSVVSKMSDEAVVEYMQESDIYQMSGLSKVKDMVKSRVYEMIDSAEIISAYENSVIMSMIDYSHIDTLGYSCAESKNNSSVVMKMCGYSYIDKLTGYSEVKEINDNTIVYLIEANAAIGTMNQRAMTVKTKNGLTFRIKHFMKKISQ